MKRKVAMLVFLMFSFLKANEMSAQLKKGDTLYYSKEWKITQKEDAHNFMVLKKREWNKEIKKYIHTVNLFKQDTLSKTFYKSEVFNT
jgi:hypothetical protein